MKTKEELKKIAKTALNSVKADQVEVGIYSHERGVTRFANSMIHQNISTEVDESWARVILGKKIGGISIGSPNEERIKRGMNTAYELAKYQKEDPDFKSLPKAEPVEKINKLDVVTPDERACGVSTIVETAKKHNLSAAGAIYTSNTTLGIFNSLGIESVGSNSASNVEITIMADDSSGFASQTARKFSDIDFKSLAEIACEKTMLSKNPTETPPGKYTVLLEPYAVDELLSYLNYLGFGARTFHEGRSFMSGKIGTKITGDNITISDDPYHPEISGIPFDFEGVPTQPLKLIENGVAKNVVYDSYYANKEGKKSTGHAIPQPNAYGPFPRSMILASGNTAKEEMLKTIDNGILITRFWYTRLVNPDNTLITGMTRDGTFLVKDGKISKGIKNLRYTINILDTLKNVLAISKESKLIGSSFVPALVIKDFNFSGKTEY